MRAARGTGPRARLLSASALACLFAVLLSVDAAGQESLFPSASEQTETEPAERSVPDPAALEPGWSRALASGTESLPDVVEEMIALAEQRTDDLPEPARVDADATLARLQANLRGYTRLQARDAAEPPRASTVRERYSLEDLLGLHDRGRETRTRLEGDEAELESRGETVAALEREYDSRFATYLTTEPRSSERLQQGLRVMALKAALLLEEQQVRLLTARVEALRVSLNQIEQELDAARDRLDLDQLSVESIEREVTAARAEVERANARQRQREAEVIDVVAASAADSMAVALRRQQVTLSAIGASNAELDLAGSRARLDLVRLRAEADENLLGDIRKNMAEREELVRRIQSRIRGWLKAGEQGLAESAGAFAGEAEARDLEQRAAVSAKILTTLQETRRALDDVTLLDELVQGRLVAREGRLRATLSGLAEQAAGAWETVKRFATASLITIGETPITLAGLFRILVILTVAFWVSRIMRHALDRMGASKRTSMSPSSLYSLGRLLHYVVVIAGIVIGLSSVGLDFTNLALVASALGVGIGFGLQSVVSNFVSGLILLFERSLNVGDFVELDSGVTGVIKEINVRSTLLNTNDNVDILVPNSEFVNGRLINWTLREAIKRIHVPFGVAYGTDKDLTKKAALEAAERVPLTLKGPGRDPQVWLINFGDSSLDYELVVWLGADAVRRPGAVQAAYLWEIETALAEHGIEIPFPQRDLHFKSGMDALGKPAPATGAT